MNLIEKMFNKNTLTYIANAGVMINIKDKKIIIDGILDKGPYRGPEDDFVEKLVLGKEPYHNIDTIFFTHSHRDHIDPEVLNELLKRNRHVRVICPTAATKLISSQRNYNEVLSPQIMTVAMKNHTRLEISLGDISFSAHRLVHDGVHHSTLENIAYSIYTGGVSITVLGDAAPVVSDYEKCDIPTKKKAAGRSFLPSLRSISPFAI